MTTAGLKVTKTLLKQMSALKAVNINLIQFEPIVTMATAAAEMAARTHSNNPPGNETRLIRLRGQTPPHEHTYHQATAFCS